MCYCSHTSQVSMMKVSNKIGKHSYIKSFPIYHSKYNFKNSIEMIYTILLHLCNTGKFNSLLTGTSFGSEAAGWLLEVVCCRSLISSPNPTPKNHMQKEDIPFVTCTASSSLHHNKRSLQSRCCYYRRVKVQMYFR